MKRCPVKFRSLLLLQYKSAPALSDLTRVCWILSRQFNQHLRTCEEAAVKSASWSKPYKQFPYLAMHQLLFLGGVLVGFFSFKKLYSQEGTTDFVSLRIWARWVFLQSS